MNRTQYSKKFAWPLYKVLKTILLWFGLHVGLYCLYFEVVEFSPKVVPWQIGVVLHYFQVSYLSQKLFLSLFSLTKHAINFSDRASELAFNFWKLDIFFFAIRPLLPEIWAKICFEGTWKCWSITWISWSSNLIKPSIYSENSEVVLQHFQVVLQSSPKSPTVTCQKSHPSSYWVDCSDA